MSVIEMEKLELAVRVEQQAKQLVQLKKKLLAAQQAKASLEADYHHALEMLNVSLA